VRSGPASQRAATSEPGRSARGADAYERAPRRSGPTRERASVAPRVDRGDGPPARRDGGGRRPFPRRDRTPQDPSFRSRNTSPAALDRLLDSQSWASLRPALEGPGVEVEPAIETLRRYARLLIEWNRSHSNLISHNDEARIVERHLIESVGPASLLKQSACRRWIDFGSGAGLPAIPLIIAGVAGAWTLVESRRTKTLFIRKALQELSLESIEVVNDRLENVVLEPSRQGAFDGFVSRATLKLTPTLTLAAKVIATGGQAFLWKGSGFEAELAEKSGWRSDWELVNTAPVGSGPNVVVVMKRR